MASQKSLALHFPSMLASQLGWEIQSLTSTGTTQGSTGGVIKGRGNRIVKATPHAGDGAFTLPADAAEGDEIIIVNMHASNSADIFPPTGHSIHKLTANGGTAVATGASISLVYLGSSLWLGQLSATPAAT